ncbi:MAG TPA: PH domain-containing protein, partial [Candidatus Yaniella excrementavium]|nr:PH domain-containing protein [Candidatus Yaniella excrementavium]
MITDTTQPWQRLSGRIIWVDLVQVLVTQLPLIIVVLLINAEPQAGQLWPLIALAAFGLIGAAADAVRWLVTRYRITPSHLELKTGVVFRQHRSIQRDRIRSIDTEAKLRHRLARLRIVTIGAGQQATTNEAAIALDALTAHDARALRERLLTTYVEHTIAAPDSDASTPQTEPEESDRDVPLRVFAKFRPSWVVYNIFNIWAYVVAVGLVFGGWWLLSAVGIDPTGWVIGLADWKDIGWLGTSLLAVAAVGIVGVVGMIVSYFTEYWNFELARVRGPVGTELRTTQGLFTTREVNRDEGRIRGYQLSQPLFWRWLGVTDTYVITTGLNLWSMAQPAAILPRVPWHVAHRTTAAILAPQSSPFEAALTKHPRAALRRRLWWATGSTLLIAAVLSLLIIEDAIGAVWLWWPAVFWPLALGGAVVAYR